MMEMMKKEKLVAVIRADNPEDGIQMARLLKEGGIKLLEITMTVPGAFEVIKELKKKFEKEIVIGAGTVTSIEETEKLIKDVDFLVGPVLDPEIIKICNKAGVIVIPGAMTPTEIFKAWDGGADFVKIFPIDILGGVKYIKALRGPFPKIPFMPTGGIDLENIDSFIAAGAELIGVGSSLADKKLIKEKKFDELRNLAEKFKNKVGGKK